MSVLSVHVECASLGMGEQESIMAQDAKRADAQERPRPDHSSEEEVMAPRCLDGTTQSCCWQCSHDLLEAQ